MVDEDQAAAAGPAVATEPAPVGSPRSGHDLDSGPRPRFSITADEPVAGAAGLGIAESIALIILFAAGALIPVLLSTGLHALTGFRIGPGGRLVLAELCGGTLALVFAVRWSGRPFREVCPLRPFPTGVIPGLVLGSIGLRAVLGELGSWTPGAERVMEGLGQMLSGGVVSYMIAVWLLAPVLEELLFRGAMLSGLRVRRSAVTAIVVSAMLFALVHGNLFQGAIALPLGLAYGWLRLRTRSVLPGMLSHAVVNASGGLVLLPGLLGLGYDMKRSSHMLHMPWPILLPGAVLALVGCLLVWRALGAGPLEGDDAPPAPSAPTGAGGARLVGSVIALLAAIVIAVMAGAWRDMGEGLQRLKPVDPKPLAGCYRLELNSRSDEAAVGFVAPVRLRLSLERYRWQDDQPATFRVQPLEGPAVTRDGGPAFWIPRRGGQVSVIAERQQTVLRMHRSGRDLAGDLVTYDRATGSVVSGSATARWIACPGNTSRGR